MLVFIPTATVTFSEDVSAKDSAEASAELGGSRDEMHAAGELAQSRWGAMC